VNFLAQRSTNDVVFSPPDIGTERRNCSTRADTLACLACASFFAAVATEVSERVPVERRPAAYAAIARR
jgi:hypothetical protein